jgi:hypothetical protein
VVFLICDVPCPQNIRFQLKKTAKYLMIMLEALSKFNSCNSLWSTKVFSLKLAEAPHAVSLLNLGKGHSFQPKDAEAKVQGLGEERIGQSPASVAHSASSVSGLE